MTNDKYYAKLVETSFDIGERRSSQLQTHPRLLELYGYTGLRTKHFLNSLLSNGKLNYVELGVYRAASLINALYNNPEITAIGIDNWQYSPTDHPAIKYDGNKKTIPWDNVRLAAKHNIEIYKIPNVTLIEKDWLELKKSDFPNPIDIIHIQPVPGIEDNQLMAILNTIYPFLQATSIILAEYHKDDRIKNIYAKWIKAKNLELNYTQMKDSDNLSNADHWWGGLGAYVVTKKDITVK